MPAVGHHHHSAAGHTESLARRATHAVEGVRELTSPGPGLAVEPRTSQLPQLTPARRGEISDRTTPHTGRRVASSPFRPRGRARPTRSRPTGRGVAAPSVGQTSRGAATSPRAARHDCTGGQRVAREPDPSRRLLGQARTPGGAGPGQPPGRLPRPSSDGLRSARAPQTRHTRVRGMILRLREPRRTFHSTPGRGACTGWTRGPTERAGSPEPGVPGSGAARLLAAGSARCLRVGPRAGRDRPLGISGSVPGVGSAGSPMWRGCLRRHSPRHDPC
jgi:hypothetical protein